MDFLQRCLLRDRELDGRGRVDALTGLWILAQNRSRRSSGLYGLSGTGRGDGRDGCGCIDNWRELEPGMGDGDLGAGKRLSDEVGHHEGRAGFDRWRGDEHADCGSLNSGSTRCGILRNDRALGSVGPGHFRGGTDFEIGTSNLDGGDAPVKSGEIGHCDSLRAQAFNNTHIPFAADESSGNGRLADNVARRNIYAVEMIVHFEIEADSGGPTGGFCRGKSLETRNRHFSSMDGEVHGGDGREEGQYRQHEQDEQESEGAEHFLRSVLDGVFDGGCFFEHL